MGKFLRLRLDIAKIRGRNNLGNYSAENSLERPRVKSAEIGTKPFNSLARGNPNGEFQKNLRRSM